MGALRKSLQTLLPLHRAAAIQYDVDGLARVWPARGLATIGKRKPKHAEIDRRTLSLRFLDEQVQNRLLRRHGPHECAIVPCTRISCVEAKLKWCACPVYLEQRNWGKLFKLQPNLMNLIRAQETDLFRKYVLPEDLKVMHVSGKKAVERGMHLLAESMKDPVLALGLEWAGRNRPVGLIQIASSSLCVLIHSRKYWRNKFLPPHLARLFMNPSVTILSFGWQVEDELKMRDTFNWGKSNFSNFIDLQEVARDMGYGSQIGLGHLTEVVTGLEIPKDIKIQRSDWEALPLKRPQVLYSAMDVFAAGHVFRQLRAWHASNGHACRDCKQILGDVFHGQRLENQNDKFRPKSITASRSDMLDAQSQGQKLSDSTCSGCGRMMLVNGAILEPEEKVLNEIHAGSS